MRLFLIRHGETVDNVAQVYAGTTDSPLTVHGSVQAQRLGLHLSQLKPRLTRIISSDLQRAVKTSEALLSAQQHRYGDAATLDVTQTRLLREQDLGSLERKPFSSTVRRLGTEIAWTGVDTGDRHPDFVTAEPKLALSARVDSFLDEYIIPTLHASKPRDEPVLAVVSHGILLSSLWKALLKRFAHANVTVSSSAATGGHWLSNIEHLGPWTNTGFLELHIHRLPVYLRTTRNINTDTAYDTSAMEVETYLLHDWTITVKEINSTDHLRGFKRTGGGVGSSRLDDSQSTIDNYFKKRRLD